MNHFSKTCLCLYKHNNKIAVAIFFLAHMINGDIPFSVFQKAFIVLMRVLEKKG